jgi:hypothetical protein
VVLERGLVGGTVVVVTFVLSDVVVVIRAAPWDFASGADEPQAARNTNGNVILAMTSLAKWRFIWRALGRSSISEGQ